MTITHQSAIILMNYEMLIDRVRGLYGGVFVWGFPTDRATKERGLCEKTESKYFPEQTEQTRLIRHLLYGFWFIFFSVYSAVFVFRCCRLSYLWVSWFRFMFTLVRHSFASLIDKQLSRKATPMFQDVLLFELFQRTLPNPFLFSFKST